MHDASETIRRSADALIERLGREIAREKSSETEKVGGVAKAGLGLELMLGALLSEITQTPLEKIKVADGRPANVATAGALLRELDDALERRRAERSGALESFASRVCADRSPFTRFVTARNRTIHRGEVPADAALLMEEMVAIIVEFQRAMGWAR